MARISDKSAYPEQILFNIKDYLIGTDDINGKKTKTFPIELFVDFLTEHISINGQDNHFKFFDLGLISGYVDGVIDETLIANNISSLLSVTNLTVNSDELIIFKVHINNGLGATQERKYFFPNLLGRGVYEPLSSVMSFSDLEIAYIEPILVPLDPDNVSANINNVVVDLGNLTGQDFLTYVNTVSNPEYPTGYRFIDDTKIYYFRFIQDGATKIYFFDVDNSVNGYNFYGIDASYPFNNGELVLFYDSGIPPVIPQEKTKLSEFENDVPYITKEQSPLYTIDIVANQIKLYKDGVEVGSEDLSIYLDDTNLARLVSGTLNPTTGIATFTRDDASTFTIDFSSLIDAQPTLLSQLTNDVGFITAEDVVVPNTELLDVGAVWVGDLNFSVYANKFPAGGKWWSSVASTVTLDASHATLDRIDLLVARTNNTVGKITGEASANPLQPNWDSETEYPIRFVLVQATSTVAVGYSNRLIFDEGLGNPTEWAFSGNVPAQVFVGTSNAYQGSKAIEVTNSLGATSRFVSLDNILMKDATLLSFWIKLKADYGQSIFVVYLISGNDFTWSKAFKTGQFGFNSSNLGYQKITIDLAGEALPPYGITMMNIQSNRKNHIGYYLDLVELQSTTEIIAPPPTPNTITHTNQLINNGQDGTNPFITALDIPAISGFATTIYVDEQDALKVDKVAGYSLTKNDLTDELKATYDASETNAKSYADSLITQLIDNAPTDANTLKELNDKILAVQAIIGGTTADGDTIVNTVAELLAVFSTYTEGVDLVTLLAGKVNTTDVYNALDCIVAGKVLDARQGKALKDLIDALTTGKEPANANIQAHISSAHAPSDAQKNSDITKAEIEAKLTGEVSSHSHAGGGYTPDPAQITITTTVSITTDTLDTLGKSQKEKNVIIDNGVNAINITVNGGTNFLASYLKHGTGAITFVQGSGRTLVQVDGFAVLDGGVGGTATISSVGTTDYLRISKAS